MTQKLPIADFKWVVSTKGKIWNTTNLRKRASARGRPYMWSKARSKYIREELVQASEQTCGNIGKRVRISQIRKPEQALS